MTFAEEISALLLQAYNTKKWEVVLEVIQRLEDISFGDDVFDGDADEPADQASDTENID